MYRCVRKKKKKKKKQPDTKYVITSLGHAFIKTISVQDISMLFGSSVCDLWPTRVSIIAVLFISYYAEDLSYEY